jgi:hypothetical protein
MLIIADASPIKKHRDLRLTVNVKDRDLFMLFAWRLLRNHLEWILWEL